MTDDVAERLERYVENHPGADVMEVLAKVGADPAAYRDVVEQLLAGEEPTTPEDTNTKTADRVRGCEPDPGTEPRPDLWIAKPSADLAYPDELLDREYWVNWILDGKERKRPVAPWETGHAYPVQWRGDLPDDERPETSFDEAHGWTEYPLDHVGLELPDDAQSEELRLGIIIPVDRPAREQRVTVIDWDDVRDPETGEVHPIATKFIQEYGGYVEISRSGKGLHQLVLGGLPGERNKLIAPIDDEPFVDGEECPGVELYDGGRHVAMTGEHVEGTDRDLVDGQDCINSIVDEFGAAEIEAGYRSGDADEERDRDPAEEPERPENDVDVEIGDAPADLPTCYARALEARVDPDSADYGTNHDLNLHAALLGVYAGYSIDELTDHFREYPLRGDVENFDGQVTRQSLEGTKRKVENDQLAPPSIPTLREKGILDEDEGCDCSIDYHGASSTDDGHREGDRPALLDDAFEHAGDEDDVEISGRATSTLPIGQLDALEPAERRRFAKQRGLDWPSTDDGRDRLFSTIAETIRNEDDRVVDAPTALGKSHTVDATRWGAREDITGDRPVVHLLETRDARDEAIETAEEHGGSYMVLLGRHEACPLAAGEFDDELTLNGEPASHWLDYFCNAGGKGGFFNAAHRYLEEHNDQGEALPCCEEGDCPAVEQWETYRDGPDGDLEYWPLVIATHNFAFAPGLRTHNNVVVDEEPDFTVDDLDTGRIREAVGAYLREIDAPVTTWEAFVQLSRADGYQTDADRESDALEHAIREDPDRDWYFEDPDAHLLAPALARAIFYAEDRANGRRFGKTIYEPPRLEAHARDDDDWNREWVSVVLDESNDVQTVRVTPDFGAARSVVGLDAHPATPIWQANTVPWIKTKQVLDPTERRLWRRYERGLRVVQVGDATRPLSGDDAPDWFESDRKLDVELEHLADEYGTQFRTAITTAQVEDDLEERMHDAGCHRPELMHFGEEKSRNDFANESIGLVNGCMDPGDDYVLDLLAELDLEAETPLVECGHCDGTGRSPDHDGDCEKCDGDGEYRERGRTFEGDDAETAREILASVRENHIAQAAGRYARNADDPEHTATVFVRTDAIPTGFADVQVSGAEWVFTDLQEAIIERLRESDDSLTARELADAVGCSKEHVRTTLERLSETEDGDPPVQLAEGLGDHGATLYSEDGLPHSGVCDIHESPTDAYRTTSRWVLAIRDPTTQSSASAGGDGPAEEGQSRVWNWRAPPDPGD